MWRPLSMIALTIAAALAIAFYALVFWPLRNPHHAVRLKSGVLAIQDARVYPSPDEPPIDHASLVIRDGRIIAVGAGISIPADAHMISCDHCVVTAGFWNTHVHFTERKWSFADLKSADTLNRQLADMLTSRGFTTVVDVGSDLRVTVSLRRRIESGELLGPKIYTAGAAQYPPHGIPFYLRETLPGYLLHFMPQPETPAEAARIEERNIAHGADVLKLFTGSYVERGKILPMPEANAQAAVAAAHRHGQLAFSHPSNLAGVRIAMNSGVDVLAHAPDTADGVDTAVLQSLVDRHMAMIPTLKMFATTVTTKAAYLDPIYAEVRQFHGLGGQLLFGTDVGYMTDYSTQDEFRALQQSGLSATDILRMLTTAPAQRFGVQAETGRVAAGQIADLVVLGQDPANDVTAFSNVEFTVRGGRVIYARQKEMALAP
jgi:imidazolonepropionase-like amidohydrolase